MSAVHQLRGQGIEVRLLHRLAGHDIWIQIMPVAPDIR